MLTILLFFSTLTLAMTIWLLIISPFFPFPLIVISEEFDLTISKTIKLIVLDIVIIIVTGIPHWNNLQHIASPEIKSVEERQIVPVPFTNNKNLYAIHEDSKYIIYYKKDVGSQEDKLPDSTCVISVSDNKPHVTVIKYRYKSKYVPQKVFNFLFLIDSTYYTLHLPKGGNILYK